MMFPKDKRIKLSVTNLNRLRIYVFKRDGECVICGNQSSPQLAHVRGRGAGGDDSPNNTVRLCGIKPDFTIGCHPLFDDYKIDLKIETYEMLEGETLHLGE